jgi:ATP-binding cassette subfamily B multidrug efflux pump
MKMFVFLKRYRLSVAVALFFMTVELFVELLQPFLISKIIDEGILKEDLSIVWLWGGVLVGCSLLAFASGVTNSFYASHVSQSFGFDVREQLYRKVQSFTFPHFQRFPASSLITRLTNDVGQLQNTIFMGLRIMMRAPLLVLGGVIMSFLVNAKLALLMLAGVPFLVLFLAWAIRSASSLFRSVQERVDHVNGVLQENLSGMRLIKAFQQNEHEQERFEEASSSLRDRTMSALRVTESTMPVILFVMNAGILAALWFGRKQIDAGGATVGDVVAVINYAARTTGALSIMSMIIMNFTRARTSAKRISEVLETGGSEGETGCPSTVPNPSCIQAGRIEFRSVSFQYPETNTTVLRNISFTAQPGETIAVMGATGSGKTTLLQLIPRLYEVTEGSIQADGVDVRDMHPEQLRQMIGYVPQDVLLFSGTIQDNIKWGKEDAAIEEVISAAQDAQIHDTIMKFKDGYDTIVGQKGVNLSGGQKQRLTIARALVRKPILLLLDDSTSALDVQTEAFLLHALSAYRCTTLLVTQKISATMQADRVLLLDEGQLIAEGTHEELLSSSPLYRRIYRTQLGEEALARA